MNRPGEREGTGSGAPSRRWPWLLALVAFALAFQGSRALWNPDEGRYAHVALEMLRSGDWLTPRLHEDVPHFAKPPLTYWAIAASLSVFGHNEWAVRLPNALAFVGTALLVTRLARHLAPGRPQLAGLVYATSLFPFVASNIVTTDTLLTAAVTLAMTGFVELWWVPGAGPRGRALLWTGFGLAFLIKGPPGLLALGAILVFAAAQGGTGGLGRLVAPGPVALFGLLAFGWYAYHVGRDPALLRHLFVDEFAKRVASDEFDRNSGLAGLMRAYLHVILLGAFPWWPFAAWRAWRMRGAAGSRGARWREPGRLLLLLWIALPLAVFVAAESRLPLYLLQLAPAVSLAVTRPLASAAWHRRAQVALVAWVLALLGAKAVAAGIPSQRDGRAFARSILALHPPGPRELVFVSHRPEYAASFYLGCEIDELDIDASGRSSPAAFRARDVAASAPPRNQGARLFVVRRGIEPQFLHDLARLRYRASRLGGIGRFGIYSEPRAAGAAEGPINDHPLKGDPP